MSSYLKPFLEGGYSNPFLIAIISLLVWSTEVLISSSGNVGELLNFSLICCSSSTVKKSENSLCTRLSRSAIISLKRIRPNLRIITQDSSDWSSLRFGISELPLLSISAIYFFSIRLRACGLLSIDSSCSGIGS